MALLRILVVLNVLFVLTTGEDYNRTAKPLDLVNETDDDHSKKEEHEQ